MVHTKGLNDVVLQREITIQTNPSYRKMHRFFFVKTLAFDKKTKLDDQKLWNPLFVQILDDRFLFLSRMANQNFSEDPMKHYSLLEVCGYILLAAGLLLICLSLLGFLGVCMLNRSILGIYTICICLMVVLQLAAGVLGALYLVSVWLQALRNNHCNPSFTYILNQIMQQYN